MSRAQSNTKASGPGAEQRRNRNRSAVRWLRQALPGPIQFLLAAMTQVFTTQRLCGQARGAQAKVKGWGVRELLRTPPPLESRLESAVKGVFLFITEIGLTLTLPIS